MYAAPPTTPFAHERARAGLTMEALAERAGVGLTTIHRLEYGATGTRSTRRLVAAALRRDPADLWPEGREG